VQYDIHQAVRAACLWLPETEEVLSHGSWSFKVRGKLFAYYLVNHHGDGRVALWLKAAPGIQESHVAADPEQFFVPPYLGTRGWLGVHLNKGLAWDAIAALLRQAYELSVPASVAQAIGKTPAIKAPRAPSVSEIDPLQSARGKARLKALRAICLKLPEVREATQFGYPVWQAGRKTFASISGAEHRLRACFWVGVEQQQLLTADARYQIPPYLGHNGWIALDMANGCDQSELGGLALHSYRHFALQRMLKALDAAP
jgi:predicted DNA-binding protein (MmcQ/YjbR family)